MLEVERFVQPASVDEAVALLGEGVAPVAGGTDFCVNPRFRAGIHTVVDVRRCGMDAISEDGGWLRIGATATMAAVANSPLVLGLAKGIIARAAVTCGSPNIRNVATLGGNAASGLPSADTVATLLALDAVCIARSTSGTRAIPYGELFLGPGRTALQHELLVEVRVPLHPTLAAFQKLGRAADDISVVNAAVAFQLEGGVMRDVRIVAGAVAPVPLRCRRAEASLEGGPCSADRFAAAADLARQEVAPITDQRASAEYRRRTCGVLVRRALEQACASTS